MSKLIYDLGANNGDDTWFYLAKGFKCVAVEADIGLCRSIESRFGDKINNGDLKVCNCAVADAAGETKFYVNEFSEWSSTKQNSKATTRNSHVIVRVPTRTLSSLISQYGPAYYVKIDIEGAELAAINSLKDGAVPLPEFISFEMNTDRKQIIKDLSSLGFSRFALVRQGGEYLMNPGGITQEGEYVACKFKNSMSGCFGKDLREPWISEDEINLATNRAVSDMQERARLGQRAGWYDIHARRDISQ
jgi:FkbM family methyltransferase